MSPALLAAVALLAGAPAIPQRLARVDTVGSSAEVAAGAGGKLVIAVFADGTPEAPTHLELQFPVRVAVEASPGLSIAKPRFARADAAKLERQEVRFEVPFKGLAPGAQELRARLDYAVCVEDPKTRETLVCLPQKKEIVHAVTVK
jgi:hypothetical protein